MSANWKKYFSTKWYDKVGALYILWADSRTVRKSQVNQCFGFCAADFLSLLAYESAEKKPKHCLTWDFLSALFMRLQTSRNRKTPTTTMKKMTMLRTRMTAVLDCSTWSQNLKGMKITFWIWAENFPPMMRNESYRTHGTVENKIESFSSRFSFF